MRYDIYPHPPADIRKEYGIPSGIYAGGRDSILPPKKKEKRKDRKQKKGNRRNGKKREKRKDPAGSIARQGLFVCKWNESEKASDQSTVW